MSLSVDRDGLWTLTGERTLQERRLSGNFEVLYQAEIRCATVLRPVGSRWFLWPCDRERRQSLRFPDGAIHPIGRALDGFAHAVLEASSDKRWVA